MVNIYGISKNHVKLFTDAVFGVAITILAVELQVPNLDNNGTINSEELDEPFITFTSYIISFIVIGLYWITYHSVFNPIKHTTDLMIWLNLLFLLFIALIPFSDKLTERYDNNQYSFIFYATVQILTGLMLFLIWQHAVRNGLLLLLGKNDNNSDKGYEDNYLNTLIIKLTFIRTIIIPIVMIISIIISFYYLEIAYVFPAIIIPISIIIRSVYKNYNELYMKES
jgi:uncharacterized membrane protein